MKKVTLFFITFGYLSLMAQDSSLNQKKICTKYSHDRKEQKCTIRKKKKKIAKIEFFNRPNIMYSCVIRLIKVKEKFRNQKLGSQLLKHAMQDLLKQKCRKIYLRAKAFKNPKKQKRLENWYKSKGFKCYNKKNINKYNMVYESNKK